MFWGFNTDDTSLCRSVIDDSIKSQRYDTKLCTLVRLLFWSSEECGVTLYCNYFQVNSGNNGTLRVPSMGKIDQFENYSY